MTLKEDLILYEDWLRSIPPELRDEKWHKIAVRIQLRFGIQETLDKWMNA